MMDDMDLMKALSHKYVKRTGTPGNYKYWYKLPSGKLVSGADAEKELGVSSHDSKIDHIKRLLLANKAYPGEGLSKKEIAAHVGIDSHDANKFKVGGKELWWSNVGRNKGDYEDHHLEEAKHTNIMDPSSSSGRHTKDYYDHIRTHHGKDVAAHKPGAESKPTPKAEPVKEPEKPKAEPEKPKAEPKFKVGETIYRADSGNAGVVNEVQFMADGTVRYSVTLESGSEQYWQEKYVDGEDPKKKLLQMVEDAQKEQAKNKADAEKKAADDKKKAEADKKKLIDEKLKELLKIHPDLHAALTEETPQAVKQAAAALQAKPEPKAEPKPEPKPEPKAEPEKPKESLATSKPSKENQAKIDDAIQTALHNKTVPIMDLGKIPKIVTGYLANGMDLKEAAEKAVSMFEVQKPMPPPAPKEIEDAHADLAEADPDYARSLKETNKLAEAQKAGENVYLTKAKAIFDKIKDDLSPKRSMIVKNMLEAINQLGPIHIKKPTDAEIVAKYNEVAKGKIKQLYGAKGDGIGDEFSKGTFIDLKEIIDNPTIDHEVETMKRGYAMKQMARLMPYFKDSWKQANIGPDGKTKKAPTFGDLDSWPAYAKRTGETVPGHIPGTTASSHLSTAVPKEVWDACPDDPATGKKMLPPRDLPIHLMPVWIYTAKTKSAQGPYQYPGLKFDEKGVPQVESQAKYQEGVLTAGIRKYAMMKGKGIDIPEHKLQTAGLTQKDIFKAMKGMTDAEAWEFAKNNYIDPGKLTAIIKQMQQKKKVKKSFALVVDLGETYVPGETLAKADLVVESKVENVVKSGMVIDIRKARIEKIERILLARRNR